jgi:hypothetical protein
LKSRNIIGISKSEGILYDEGFLNLKKEQIFYKATIPTSQEF